MIKKVEDETGGGSTGGGFTPSQKKTAGVIVGLFIAVVLLVAFFS